MCHNVGVGVGDGFRQTRRWKLRHVLSWHINIDRSDHRGKSELGDLRQASPLNCFLVLANSYVAHCFACFPPKSLSSPRSQDAATHLGLWTGSTETRWGNNRAFQHQFFGRLINLCRSTLSNLLDLSSGLNCPTAPTLKAVASPTSHSVMLRVLARPSRS